MVLTLGAWSPAIANDKNVLIVYSDTHLNPGLVQFDKALREIVTNKPGVKVNLFTEFLDFALFPDAEHKQMAARYLHQKYKGRSLDAIVAVRAPSYEFLLQNRESLFTGIPIVHVAVEQATLSRLPPPADVYGEAYALDYIGTVRLALRIHPKVRKVIFIVGTGAGERSMHVEIERQIGLMTNGPQIEIWNIVELSELLPRIAALSPDTVILTIGTYQDALGRLYSAPEIIRQMSQASSVPIYGVVSPQVGAGIVGGVVVVFESIGRATGEAILSLLAGEAPNYTRMDFPRQWPAFDWRQLKRWGIDEAALPPGSKILFREYSFWDLYKWYLILAIAIFLLQTGILAVLVFERRARRRLEADNHLMRLAARAAHVGAWQCDFGKATIKLINHTQAVSGLDDPITVTFNDFIDAVHPDYRGVMRRLLSVDLKANGVVQSEFRYLGHDSVERWGKIIGRVEAWANGRPKLARGVIINITDQKNAEYESQRQRSQLAHLSRIGSLGQMSGALAHELNQPLTAILSNAQAALRFLDGKSPNLDEVREILADIAGETERSGQIIRRLRALLRDDETERQTLNVNHLVRETIKLLHGDLVTRGVLLNSYLDAGEPKVKGDFIQLQQVLLNLIINACDAMEANAPADRIITLRSDVSYGTVNISVADRGVGLPAELLPRLFDPFVSGKAGGMGLGLSISRSIVHAHDGRIWAENNPEKGATFVVSLPTAAGAAQ